MKIYLLVLLTVVISCKSKLEQYQIKDYNVSIYETFQDYQFYLKLQSRTIDSIYIKRYIVNNAINKNSADVIHDCIAKNINVNEKFLRTIIYKERLSSKDTTKILSYVHLLTEYSMIDNIDLNWNNNFQIFKQNILIRYKDTMSEEHIMYKNVFEDIANNLKNYIYLLDTTNLTSNNNYNPIYRLILIKNKEIDFKEITCDFGKIRNPYE